MAKDPVCGMDVDEKTAEHKAEHMGETYYFCASGCKKAFEEDPGKYLKGEAEMEMHEHEKKPWWKLW
ncbi:MAG: YHS domain-containing protein [Candidatus Hydrothermarchaeales archaeon]